MSAAAKAEVIENVHSSSLPVTRVLVELGVARSTYYRWIRQKRSSLSERARVPWNRLRSVEEETVLAAARASPEWSSRQVAAWITDNKDFSVSEASVYRLLRREGLVRHIEVPDPASDEYASRPGGRINSGQRMLRTSALRAGATTTWSP